MIRGLVSIIIPFQNSKDFLKSAIDSVLFQSYSNWELILVDDGSNDGIEEIISEYSDCRIKYKRIERGGVSRARNYGISNSSGEFILFLDSDDILTPQSIISRVEFLQLRQDVDLVDGSVLVIDFETKRHLRTHVPIHNGIDLIRKTLNLKKGVFFGINWLIRRKYPMPMFDEKVTHGEDLLFFVDYTLESNAQSVSNTVLICRKRTNSSMANIKGLREGYISIIKKAKSLESSELSITLLKLKIIRILSSMLLKRGEVKETLSLLKEVILMK